MQLKSAFILLAVLAVAGCLNKDLPRLSGDYNGQPDVVVADVDVASVDSTLDLGSVDLLGKDMADLLSDVAPEAMSDVVPDSNDTQLVDLPDAADAGELVPDAAEIDDVPPEFDTPATEVWDLADVSDQEWDTSQDGWDLAEEMQDQGCIPVCDGLDCGDDGCGGLCGECTGLQEICLQGVCACIPDCEGKECGQDGCGSTCGQCGALPMKCQNGACICQPQCDGKDCGDDQCGGSCGDCVGDQMSCDAGVCTCTPACDGLECGPDGCGGVCGECQGTQDVCFMGGCLCIEVCTGKECGDDGCGGSCGQCPGENAECLANVCVCTPTCGGNKCGPDGCGGNCGVCPNEQDICFQGQCLCVQDCAGKECGDNGCGGLCGACSNGESCQDHTCVCQPVCTGRQCGPDGCGGTCVPGCDDKLVCTIDQCNQGQCSNPVQDFFCLIGGACVPSGTVNPDNACEKCKPAVSKTGWSQVADGTACEGGQVCFAGSCCDPLPACLGKDCGDNGCGGVCGLCGGPFDACVGGVCTCQPQCVDKECGPDLCGGECGVCAGGAVCQDAACTCVPEFETECCGDDVCWLDSCGVSGGTAAVCPFGCEAGECANCTPECAGKECGPDACGGSCGKCTGQQEVCLAGLCTCQPKCAGLACGPDGCGGVCGECAGAQDACVAGACICQPDCQDKVCGPDGCAGNCGQCLGSQDSCVDGACVCQPACENKLCGPDGCDGACGSCDDGLWCTEDSCLDGACSENIGATGCLIDSVCYEDGEADPTNSCLVCSESDSQEEWTSLPDGFVCQPGHVCYQSACCDAVGNCTGKECGSDGCGSNCGVCSGAQDACLSGLCVCIPDCAGKVCGDDGCGGSCGACSGAQDLCVDGSCICQPECTGHQCGSDGCGGSCGSCVGPQDICVNHQCVCQPACVGLQCGPDGCGDACGACLGAQDLCVDGQCVCQPACDGKECGADGCGGECGTCGWGYKCDSSVCVVDPCKGISYEGCCDGQALYWCQNNQLYNQKCNDNPLCGWNVANQYYGCGTAGLEDPGGEHPIVCPECQPDCDGKQCGPDGCGGTCGACIGVLAECVDGTCVCQPDCTGKVCGDDGCGGSCGTCQSGFDCVAGACVELGTCDDGNAVDWDGCTNGEISEFQVNTHWSDAQLYPVVTNWPDNRFAIAWQSAGQDGDDKGIYARLYAADGSASTAEFQVNSQTDDKQEMPAVDVMSNNRLVACWQSKSQDGNDYGVYCRKFHETGLPASSEFKANSYTDGAQMEPDVAGLKGGYLAVVWEGKGSSDSAGIWLRVWDDEGDSDGQVRVNSTTSGTQADPAVSGFSNGTFMVVWRCDGQDAGGKAVCAQRFSKSGYKSGAEFVVNQNGSGDQQFPHIATLSDDTFVVVWNDKSGSFDSDGVTGRVLASTGAPLTGDFPLNTTTVETQSHPRVAAFADTDFSAVWQSDKQDTDKFGIAMSQYSSAGSPTLAEQVCNVFVTDEQQFADVAAFGDGSSVVVWHSDGQDGSSYGIFALRYDADGSPIYH